MGNVIDYSIPVEIATMLVAVTITITIMFTIAVVSIFVAVPAFMTSCMVPPVAVKRRNNATTQNDGCGT
jgi:hypothetical protein